MTILESSLAEAEKQLAGLKLDITSLENQKKVMKELPEEKTALLKQKREERYVCEMEMKEMRTEADKIQHYLATLQVEGVVSVSGNVYTGVRVIIKDIIEDVRVDSKATTFFLQNGLVRYGPYVDYTNDEDAKRVPSGYTAN